MWNFGDGSTSTAQNPTHTYSTSGTFAAQVNVTSADSTASSNISINVTPQPTPITPVTVSASANPQNGTSPLDVSFTTTPSGGNGTYSYLWNFGDGSTSTVQNPTHTYSTSGTFAAQVTVTSADSTASSNISINVTPQPTPITPVTVSASASLTSGTAPLNVIFTTTPNGGNGTYSYLWNFGDGSTSTVQNPTHTYSTSGTFAAQVNVTSAGSTGSSNIQITTTSLQPITVLINANTTSGKSPLIVSFTTTPNGGSGTYTYSWNFGDGSTSTVQNPTHTYSVGTFTAQLTVSDNAGNIGSSTTKINVNSATTGGKRFSALYLQYVDLNSQLNIYLPNMDANDLSRLRAQNGAFDSSYVAAALSLPGDHAAAFTSSADIVSNAKLVKNLGFDTIEFNLESGVSPSSDNADVVGAMKKAADAAHAVGLKFRATPSKTYTKDYGTQIAAFSDYFHLQAQSQQGTCGTSSDGYKSFVDMMVPKLKAVNPNLVITVQVSTQQSSIPGMTMLQTLETCYSEVSYEVDGSSVWFGGSDLNVLQAYVKWFHTNYSGN